MRLVSYTRTTSCISSMVPSNKEIAEQNSRIKAYADAHGWKIRKTYSDRKNDPKENKGFQELLEDGICRTFDAVIVDSVFHAGCDFPTGRQVLLQTFHYAGIAFIVVEDDFISLGKSNKEAESYYNKKQGVYVHGTKKAKAAQIETKQKKQDSLRGKIPVSKYTGLITDSAYPGQAIILRNAHVPEKAYFTVYDPSRPQFSQSHLPLSEVEDALFAMLLAEKGKAEKMMKIIRAEGESGKLQMEEQIRTLFFNIAMQIAESEKHKMEAYRKYKTGQLSGDEWNEINAAAKAFVEEQEPTLKRYEQQFSEIKTLISEKNPWIQARMEWNEDRHISRKLLLRHVEKIELNNMKLSHVTFTHEEWYLRLPQQWREN